MLIVLYLFFWVVALGFTIWMFWIGATLERWVAGILLAAAILSNLVAGYTHTRWHSPQLGLLAVDVALLVVLAGIAFASRRYWPLTLASLQLLGVATHPALWLDPNSFWLGYSFLQGFWCYPMMAVAAAGAIRDRRRRADERPS